jgi:cobalamin-dependent methionine synthase I
LLRNSVNGTCFATAYIALTAAASTTVASGLSVTIGRATTGRGAGAHDGSNHYKEQVMYENQASNATGVSMGFQGSGHASGYIKTEAQPDLPLLDYAIQEITRLTADIAQELQRVNKFVDGVRGPVPTLLNSANVSEKAPPAPNRGEALREAIRHLQVVRNAADEAASRLGGI